MTKICFLVIHSAILKILTFQLFDIEKVCERYGTPVTEMSTRNKGMHLLVYYFCIRISDILWRRKSNLSSVS
jgi:hypothetical protein